MRLSWRYIMSFFREEVIERADSNISPGLEVWYAYGRKMLNSTNVNYSFGRLDKVFRSAFKQLKIHERPIKSVLLLGLGAGNVPTILREINPKIAVVAVEIDPVVVRLGEKHFGLGQGPQLEIIVADAIDYVKTCDRRFDMIVVDIFIDDQVPDRACEAAFLQQLAALLHPSGLLIFNRLAHTAGLLQQTEEFGRKMMAALPGTHFMEADLNKVLVYEKK